MTRLDHAARSHPPCWRRSGSHPAANGEMQKIGAPPEASNMRLVGYNDLQARSAYQPTIVHQGDRYLAYIGHHGGTADIPKPVNPLTGQAEFNGTSIVDVTDPAHPKYLKHIPGAEGGAEGGGAQMVRVCPGATLPKADRGKFYMLRTFGTKGHEIWDVTDPTKPALLATIGGNYQDTHKSWWECDTGIGYLVSAVPGLARQADDRDLRSQRSGPPGEDPRLRPARPGARRDRAGADRIARADLDAADQPGLFRLRQQQGRHPADRRPRQAAAWARRSRRPTTCAIRRSAGSNCRRWSAPTRPSRCCRCRSPSSPRTAVSTRDFVLITNEATAERMQAAGPRDDVVRRHHHRGPSDDRLELHGAGGERRFLLAGRALRRALRQREHGAGVLQEARLRHLLQCRACARSTCAIPMRPRRSAISFRRSRKRPTSAASGSTASRKCKTAIQTNNAETDDRGYIYIVDRANTGMHVLELTGEARAIAGLRPQ